MDRKNDKKKRPKMPNSHRAKQFAPFDALTGLTAALKQAEIEHAKQYEIQLEVDLKENHEI